MSGSVDLALRPETTSHAVAALERNERRRVLVAEAVEMRTRLTTQMQEMLESLVRDERRAGAAPLEQRIRRGRRPVRETGNALHSNRARCSEH